MKARGPVAGLLALALSIGSLGAGEAPKTPPPPPAKDQPAPGPEEAAAPSPPAAPAGEAAETAQQRADRLAALYERAEALYAKGLYREAQAVYAQIALEEPNYRRVNSRLRDIRSRLQDEERREREARIERLLNEAAAHFGGGSYAAAAKACEEVLALEPDNKRAQRRLAECAGELELGRRMRSIFEHTDAPAGPQLVAQAGTALAPQAPAAWPPPPMDAAPAVRSTAEVEPVPPRATRVVRPGENVEVGEAPGPPATKAITPTFGQGADQEGAALLSKAWDLYQSAKLAKDPRPQLHQALDTLAPVTPVSPYSQQTKDTATLLRNSIARHLADSGRAMSPEEAQKARLYGCYVQAEELFRKHDYDGAIGITDEILAQDKSFTLARHLNQEAKLEKQQAKMSEMELEHRVTVEKRIAEAEAQGIPPESPPPIERQPVNLARPTYEVASPELEEKLNQRVSVNLIDADLDYFLDLLFRSTGVNIIYNPEVVQGKTITVHIANYPLRQLLDYIARNHGLMFATTRDGVLITTPEEPRLETFVVPLHYGLVDVEVAPPSADMPTGGGAQPPIDPPTSSNLEKLVDVFPQLIDWPQGSFTYLDRKMNVLYVRTTRDAYQGVIRMLEAIDKVPLQCLIKALFLEINAEDFDTFGITSKLSTDLNLGRVGRVDYSIGQGTIFNFPVESLPGQTASGAGLAFTLSGVLSEKQFELAVDALQRTGRTRTLAAPSIICMNNSSAIISVTKNLVYVEDYEVDRSDISGTTIGNPYNNFNPNLTPAQQAQQLALTQPLSSEPIIIPVFAEGEDTGFTLDVAPSIGLDSRFITLTLNPRIREEIPPRLSFELVFPFTQAQLAQQQAAATAGGTAATTTPQQQTAVVERPIIGTRSLSTKLTVADGSIVALGGLIQQKKVEVISKVPVISDIPILGKLFQRKTFQDQKTVLIIFVQVEILTPTGTRYADAGQVGQPSPVSSGSGPVELEGPAAPAVRPAVAP